jgi:hypothetical protein
MMTLTTDDLQAIGTLIDEKLDAKLEEKLGTKLDQKLGKFEEKFEKKLEEKLEQKFDQKFEPINKTLKYLKKKVNRMDKTLDIVARTYDQRIVANTRDIAGIKTHLGLSANF